MRNINEVLDGVKTIAIAGHVRPDGDCVGSCMGLYLYLTRNYPQIETDIYLEQPSSVFSYIEGLDKIHTEITEEKVYDLFISCDASSIDRIGVAGSLFEKASTTVCIDHHISNKGFAMINEVQGHIGSASEVLYTLLDADKVDRSMAIALYTGIIHDTGVFQYTNATPATMRIAAALMETGFDHNKIIDESFYQKSYLQNQILGRVLTESQLCADGKVIVGTVTMRDLEFYGITSKDLDGIVSQLRLTKGVKVAVFLYEQEENVFKVSLRVNDDTDVSKVAITFGGGGHAKAAGCTMNGPVSEIVDKLIVELKKQDTF